MENTAMLTGSATARPTKPRLARSIASFKLLGRAAEKLGVVALSAAILLIFTISVPVRLRQLMTYCATGVCAQQQLMPSEAASLRQLGLSLEFYATFLTALECVLPTGCAIVAALLLSRSRERITLYLALMLVAWGAAMPPTMEALAAGSPSWRLPVLILQNLASFLLISFFYVFPDGRAIPRITTLAIVAWGAWNVVRPAFTPTTPFRPASLEGLVILALLAGGAAAQVYRYQRRSNAHQRQQTKWAVYGLAITSIGIIAFVLPHSVVPAFLEPGTPRVLSFLITIPPFMTFASLCLPLSIGVAVLRGGLYDIDIIINRTLVYAALTLMLSATYAALVIALESIVRAITGQESVLAVVFSTLVIAWLFQPLRKRTQAVIDQRFYRRRYSAARTIMAFIESLPNDGDLPALSARLTGVVQRVMEPSAISLWLRPTRLSNEDEAGEEVVGYGVNAAARPEDGGAKARARWLPGLGRGRRDSAQRLTPTATRVRPAPMAEIGEDDPIVTYFLAAPVTAEVDRLPGDSLAVQALRAAGAQLVTPLVSQGELVGMLILGRRLSGEDYSTVDRSLLNTLATQVAPAVRVAQMVREQQAEARERERIEQELRVARLIQQTLLPKELPSLPGWRLAARYQPARAVGGDFYDFLYFPDGQLGVIIGDVTDKGVPAALVMATTRSILRSVAQRDVSPGLALERVNDLLCPDIPPGMFVTCFYAVLDPKAGRLCFANAGHDLPYLRRGDTVTELRATGMPLGLMPGMRYEEGEITLAPGDSVLLYSDGLVEAHNAAREMFGFARLASLIGELPAGEPMIAPILKALAAFTGPGWEQEDDVTFVTLQWRRVEVMSPSTGMTPAGDLEDVGAATAAFGSGWSRKRGQL